MLSIIGYSQTPPPPNNGNPNDGGGIVVGGGAPIGSGLIMLIGMSAFYAITRKNDLVMK